MFRFIKHAIVKSMVSQGVTFSRLRTTKSNPKILILDFTFQFFTENPKQESDQISNKTVNIWDLIKNPTKFKATTDFNVRSRLSLIHI